MAKKKSVKASDLISMYMNYVLEHNEHPKSVYSFTKSNNIEESIFYQHFGNFDALEQSIFKAFFDNTIAVIEENEDYNGFDARNKMLSFYYTFFEILTANRSYVVHALKGSKNLKGLKTLTKLKHTFSDYFDTLDIETIDIKEKRLEQIQDKALQESAWIQLLITIKFWLDDTSASFEKTDLFIEKTVNASFDIIDIKPIKTVMDLGKFLFKEKFQMN